MSFEPLSAAIVKFVVIPLNDKLPEPSVFNTCPLEPSEVGKVYAELNVTAPAVLITMSFARPPPPKCRALPL